MLCREEIRPQLPLIKGELVAEPAKPKQKTAAAPPPPPAPEPPPAETPVKKRESKFMKYVSRLMTTTALFGFGVGFIILAVFIHLHGIPGIFIEVVTRLNLHMSYLFVGLGLLCIGQARHFLRLDFSAEYKKNRQFSHAWKIPLIIAEVLIYQVIGFYGLLVGIGKVVKIENLLGLIALLILFLLYVLWYAIAFTKNRFPSFAAFRVAAFLGLIPAFISFLLWTSQFIFLSLVLALIALIASFISLQIKSTPTVEQRLTWIQFACVTATLGLLLIVGMNASLIGKPRALLVGHGLASPDPGGEIGVLAYSPENKKELNNPKTLDNQKIAFSLKKKEGWFLQIIDARVIETVREEKKSFIVPAGEASFHPVFIENGKSLVLDAVKGGERGLWKVDAATGATTRLLSAGVEPFGDGILWSEKTKQILYVTSDGSEYQLHAYPAGKGKKILLKSSAPIFTPSWTMSGGEISYADGVHGEFNVLNVRTGVTLPLLSDQERAEKYKAKDLPVKEVIPAPDGFRYLYLANEGKNTSIWVVLADGTKRKKIYEENAKLQNVSWFPDGQKILFEETRNRSTLMFYPNCFLTESKRARILDANLDTAEDLIPSQVSHRAPAVSPDGVKVAFVGDQGLWFHYGNPGIWVAFLR